MHRIYVYDGKVYIEKDGYNMQVNEDEQYVKENINEYLEKLEKIKGEIENGR